MSKTILRHGYNQKVCYCTCGCIFAYEEEDLITEPTQSYARTAVGATAIKYVICPECGAKVYIASAPVDLPPQMPPIYPGLQYPLPTTGDKTWPYPFNSFYCGVDRGSGDQTSSVDVSVSWAPDEAAPHITLVSNQEKDK